MSRIHEFTSNRELEEGLLAAIARNPELSVRLWGDNITVRQHFNLV